MLMQTTKFPSKQKHVRNDFSHSRSDNCYIISMELLQQLLSIKVISWRTVLYVLHDLHVFDRLYMYIQQTVDLSYLKHGMRS